MLGRELLDIAVQVLGADFVEGAFQSARSRPETLCRGRYDS